MPCRKRQLPTVQLDLFRSPGSQSLDWVRLPADVREKVTRLMVLMLSRLKVPNRPGRSDGGQDDE